MKFDAIRKINSHSQVFAILLFVILPIWMIVTNGLRAVQGIVVGSLAPETMRHEPLDEFVVQLVNPTQLLETSDKTHAEGMLEASCHADRPGVKFGVYDPQGEFKTDGNLKLRHIYVSWAEFDVAQLRTSLRRLESEGYEVLLTIEPWPKNNESGELLPAILAGHYDVIIDELARVLSVLKGPTYVSWGHEMDQDLIERYPWSGTQPDEYVKAFRYVVDRMRAEASTQLRWVWAGVLKEGSARYWPGDAYVDFIGMLIYSFPAWDQKTYGYIRDFKTTFEEKLSIVKEMNKPIMITELGVSGSPDFESFWLHQAFLKIYDYPQLAAIVFFYSQDTEGAWGRNFDTPDWRVHPESIRGLVDWSMRSSICQKTEVPND